VDLERILDDLFSDLVKAGFVPGKVSKATRRGCKAARGRTLEALVAFRVFLTRCPEARNYLGRAGRHTFSRDDTLAGGEPLSRRGPEVALEEVFRQVGRAAESVASGHGGPPPVRVWRGDQWVSCFIRRAPWGPDGNILLEPDGHSDNTTMWMGLESVHPADHAEAARQAARLAGETGELGPDWLKMRGGSDGSGQQDDPPEGPAAAGRG
jgi:hypothetical protein